MIISFRHKGLARLYQRAERRGIAAEQLAKVERILARLDVANRSQSNDFAGLETASVERKAERLLVGLGIGKLADHISVPWYGCG